jgi:hypothetical protein
MAFRVLVAGPSSFLVYARLSEVLDVALVNCFPDVVSLIIDGPGLLALATSYARSRGLELKTCGLDY